MTKDAKLIGLLVLGYIAVIAGIVHTVRPASATKAAIQTALQSGFSGLTGALSPTATWDKTATAIHNGVTTGTSTNDSASAGQLGEYVQSYRSNSAALNAASGAQTVVASITLTPGDWDVSGFGMAYAPATPSAFTRLNVGINTTTTFDFSRYADTLGETSAMPNDSCSVGLAIPPFRASVAASTTFYLIVKSDFTAASQMQFWGRISARRVR